MGHGALDASDELGAQSAGELLVGRSALRADDDLRLAPAIAQVDEEPATMVAVAVNPAAESDFLPDVLGPQIAASMCSKQRRNPRN
jgi:hypothetical protein